MRHLTTPLALLVSAFVSGCFSPPKVSQDKIAHAEQGSVTMSTLDIPHSPVFMSPAFKAGGGIAVEWDDQLYAVTERHVTSQGPSNAAGPDVYSTPVHQDDGFDVIVPFWASYSSNPGVSIFSLDGVTRDGEMPEPMELAKDIRPGDRVYFVGPYGRGSTGEVKRTTTDKGIHAVVMELDIHLGDSGYPIIRRRDGKVIGTLYGFVPGGWNPFGKDEAVAVSSLEIRQRLRQVTGASE